jgi:hypothetical protein
MGGARSGSIELLDDDDEVEDEEEAAAAAQGSGQFRHRSKT